MQYCEQKQVFSCFCLLGIWELWGRLKPWRHQLTKGIIEMSHKEKVTSSSPKHRIIDCTWTRYIFVKRFFLVGLLVDVKAIIVKHWQHYLQSAVFFNILLCSLGHMMKEKQTTKYLKFGSCLRRQLSAGAIFPDSQHYRDPVAFWENLIWDKSVRQKHCSQTRAKKRGKKSNINMLLLFERPFAAPLLPCMHAK